MRNGWLYKNDIKKLSTEEKQKMYETIQKRVECRRKHRRLKIYLSVSAVACIAVLLIVFKSLISEQMTSPENFLSHITDSLINETDIRLILSNNKTITFEKNVDIKYNNKEEITVDTGDKQIRESKVQNEDAVLNTLIVPKGKRSSLTLADGSKVWINSGSALRFPTHFNESRREIWVEGEVYIEVVKDKSRPFYVNTNRMVIDVVGTQFNVSAYKEDAEHAVVLVEGCVNININTEITRLSPNQMFTASMNNNSVKSIDVSNYVSWKDGYLQFASEPLGNILKRLSRYYDLPIHCDENCSMLKCNGKLILFSEIEEVLETISNTVPVKFSVEENQITVYKN